MRQEIVNRSVLVLSAVFVAACAAFAWVVGLEPPAAAPPAPVAPVVAADAASGARLFASRCARCHSLEEALQPLREARPGSDARADYIELLRRHRKSAADEHAPITDYLLSLRVADAPG